MTAVTSLTLPVPPSSNRFWRKFRNRIVLSEEARAYKAAVAERFGNAQPEAGPVAVFIDWYRARKSGDLDRRLSVLLDALQGVAYCNDRQIVELHARRFEDRSNPRVEVTIDANPALPQDKPTAKTRR